MNITSSTPERVQFETRERYERNSRALLFVSDVNVVTPASPARAQRNPGTTWRVVNQTLNFVPPLMLGFAILFGWYLATLNGRINPLILPAPNDVFASLVQGLSSGMYTVHILATLQESLLGFVLAAVLALPMGYGIVKSRFLARLIQPYLAAGQAIPSIVLAPFLFLWLGMGSQSVIVICMLVVLFPLVVNTILGLETIEKDVIEAARLEGAHGLSLLTHIEFPLSLPSILAAVRTSLTLSITGALVGEFFCSPDKGLGALLQMAMHQYNMAFMFATVIILAVLAALYYSATRFLVKLAEVIY